MFKKLIFGFLLYTIIWWILFTVYFNLTDTNKNRDYKKEGLYSYITSFIYFIIFCLVFFIVDNIGGSGNSSSISKITSDDN